MGVLGRLRGAIRTGYQKVHLVVCGAGHTTDAPTILEEVPVSSQPSSLRDRTPHYMKRKTEAVNPRVHASYNRENAQLDSVERSMNVVERISTRGSSFTERYVVIRNVGCGGNGEVDLCRDSKKGTLVAVKTISHNDSAPPSEVVILKMLGRHENIVEFHTMLSHTNVNGDTQLIFEYCPMGDLVDYINTLTEPVLAETFIWHIFKHTTSGLHHMHRQGFIHGDIKDANIVLTAPRQGEHYPLPKIADFGTASFLPLRTVPQGHLGTRGYQPPEWENRYGPEADIWALGCILHEMAHGTTPVRKIEQPESTAALWFHTNSKRIPPNTPYQLQYQDMCYFTAFHAPSPLRIDSPCRDGAIVYSKLLNYFMMRCLDFDPDLRISLMELCQLLPTLETLVHNIFFCSQEHLLDQFDDGHDEDWNVVKNVRDSGVLKAIFCAFATRSSEAWYSEILEWGTHLLPLMEPLDQVAACHYVRYAD